MIVPEAFAHPAKFSRSLIARILSHGLEVGWWRPGDVLGDPFGGVALGGLMAAYAGLGWVGVELEAKFIGLGTANIDLQARRLASIGAPRPVLLQGDSRRFSEIVGGVGAVVTSPPFGVDQPCASQTRAKADYHAFTRGDGTKRDHQMNSAGNIANLPTGSIAAVVTSPPYAESLQPETAEQTRAKQGRIARSKSRYDGRKLEVPSAGKASMGGGYGVTDGQIGSLAAGNLDGVVTSPPWEDQAEGGLRKGKFKDPAAFAAAMTSKDGRGGRHASTRASRTAQLERDAQRVYGDSKGQIGIIAGETYWQAMAQVYTQCRLALRPGGIMAVVVKDYVKNKARVPLCDQTLALLVSLGFTPVARIHAMLVKEQSHPQLIGPDVVTKRERKSFFRRLAEKKGSPRIDFEEVIVVLSPEAIT